jgi:glycosyltransferase involved in cell wall biosynthesis
VQGKFVSKLKRRLTNYRLGLLASEVKKVILDTPREMNRRERRCLTLKPVSPSRGSVLLCYNNKAFFLKPDEAVSNDHTNIWESLQIGRTFLELGYRVDVIHEDNDRFVPAKHYSFFVGNRINFDRIAESLNQDCVKILHIDTAHWLFHNFSEHRRLLAVQQRRGFTLPKLRSLKPNLAIEHADYATILGNDFTIGTYRYANKPLYRVPISSPVQYSWPEDKDFEASRRQFLWFGSKGFVHKGLDLVLEAFAEMPDYQLTVCGPIDKDPDFKNAYHTELYRTPNVHTVGWVDIESQNFLEICRRCIALIYPSCSEGGGGSVISCMHAGLIPIVSREASVDVNEDFGLVLKECSIQEIKNSIKNISSLSSEELQRMARAAWNFARANHTRERFAEEYRNVISLIMTLVSDNERALQRTVTTRDLYDSAARLSDT